MSLVAGYGSGSGESSDEEEKTGPATSTSSARGLHSLFSTLPVPKSSSREFAIKGDDDFKPGSGPQLAMKKKKDPVRILVPALSKQRHDDDDSDEEKKAAKKLKRAPKGSGLFSLLPEPKNSVMKMANRSLIPHTLTKKPATSTRPKSKPSATVTKSSSVSAVNKSSTSLIKDYGSDEEEEDGVTSFFSFENKTAAKPEHHSQPTSLQMATPSFGLANINPNNTSLTLDPASSFHGASEMQYNQPYQEYGGNGQQFSSWPEYGDSAATTGGAGGDQMGYNQPYGSQQLQTVEDQTTASSADVIQQEVGPQDLINDQNFQRLIGKHKRGKEEINFIDISDKDRIGDNKEHLKLASQEKPYGPVKLKKGEMPSGSQKRKHQITYLAFQAKQRELELKNTWAENRATRRQTQSKYGF